MGTTLTITFIGGENGGIPVETESGISVLDIAREAEINVIATCGARGISRNLYRGHVLSREQGG